MYQVRGHLAAQIDPLGLNNMDREQAKKMIVRSVTVEEKVRFEQKIFHYFYHLIHCTCPGVV